MHPEAAIVVHNYLDIAFISIFFYDYGLNLGSEVDHIWKHVTSRGSLWYLFIRYFTFAGFVFVYVFNFIKLDPSGCNIIGIVRQALIVMNTLMISIIFTMRTYALYEKSGRVLCLIVVTLAALLSTACWALGTQQNSEPYDTSIFPGCHVPTSKNQAQRMIIAWGCVLGFDTFLFILTAARAVRRTSPVFRALRSSSYMDLVRIIYRDVAIYYGVMVLFNLATVICFYKAPDMLRAALTTPTSVMSALLCAHVILNIREATAGHSPTQATHHLQTREQVLEHTAGKSQVGSFRMHNTSRLEGRC